MRTHPLFELKVNGVCCGRRVVAHERQEKIERFLKYLILSLNVWMVWKNLLMHDCSLFYCDFVI